MRSTNSQKLLCETQTHKQVNSGSSSHHQRHRRLFVSVCRTLLRLLFHFCYTLFWRLWRHRGVIHAKNEPRTFEHTIQNVMYSTHTYIHCGAFVFEYPRLVISIANTPYIDIETDCKQQTIDRNRTHTRTHTHIPSFSTEAAPTLKHNTQY